MIYLGHLIIDHELPNHWSACKLQNNAHVPALFFYRSITLSRSFFLMLTELQNYDESELIIEMKMIDKDTGHTK